MDRGELDDRGRERPGVLALLLLVACGCHAPDPRSRGTEPRDTVSLAWTLTAVRTLGEVSGDLALHGIDETSVAVDSRGRLAVLDKGNDRILFTGSGGGVKWIYDRGGHGPGELSHPMAIWITDAGIHVLEGTRVAVITLSEAGVFVEESLSGLRARGWTAGPIRGVGDHTFFTVSGPGPNRAKELIESLVRADGRDTTELASIVVGRDAEMAFPDCRITYQVEPLFAPHVRWAVSGGLVVWAADVGYQVQIRRSGGSTRGFGGDWPIRAISRADALAHAERWRKVVLNGRECSGDPVEIIDGRDYARQWQTIRRLAIGPSGEVWVEAQATQESHPRLFVHGKDGRLEGELPSDTPFPLLFTSPDEYVTIITDELEVEYVSVVRVARE